MVVGFNDLGIHWWYSAVATGIHDTSPPNTLLEVRVVANEHQEDVFLQDLRKQAVGDHEYQ